MDRCAENNSYIANVEKHQSQKDYSHGFGGKFGVQTDRQDKSAKGWDHIEKVDKHQSQKGNLLRYFYFNAYCVNFLYLN